YSNNQTKNNISNNFFFQAEDGIRDFHVTGVQTCTLPISPSTRSVAVSWVVVVLPLVPVMSTQSAGVPSARTTLSRTRQASSTSPQSGITFCWAQTITGCEGENPGEATITSGAKSRSASGTSARGPSSRRAPMTGTSRAYSSEASSERTSTSAPSSVSVSAAEKPVTLSPSTATRSPRQSACQLVRVSRRSVVMGQPFEAW